ncbi:DUF4410 domain-containing protein [Nguyenibacter vanlangensis]|uniref:DUF4410 domain-containing protein n=2 Tax=Nguyenibacter vanlangensis TaxID=1216886 RepID=A0A7Y7IUG1_9PROT|nr:DUF4410 domain-containing protein [Nguyenibacter vanlangensis]
MRMTAAGGALIVLSGCAGAHVDGPATARDVRPVAPVAVDVTSRVVPTSANAGAMDSTMSALVAGLVQSLRKAHIAAHPASGDEAPPHEAGRELALVVDVSRLQSGNAWTRESIFEWPADPRNSHKNFSGRTLVGFGAGKSCLQAHVMLVDMRGVRLDALLDFTVRADSGAMPGVAVSAWNPIGLEHFHRTPVQWKCSRLLFYRASSPVQTSPFERDLL